MSRDHQGQGLTWVDYQEGLALWRRNKEIYSPWLGPNPNLYMKKRLIGYSVVDMDILRPLETGATTGGCLVKNNIWTARWGYAMYVTDDPAM